MNRELEHMWDKSMKFLMAFPSRHQATEPLFLNDRLYAKSVAGIVYINIGEPAALCQAGVSYGRLI